MDNRSRAYPHAREPVPSQRDKSMVKNSPQWEGTALTTRDNGKWILARYTENDPTKINNHK